MDPLAQLKDIHLPDAIPLWPLAPGWWILIICILAAIAYATQRYLKHRRFWQVKRQGLDYLMASDSLSSEQSLTTLKWVCLHYFQREKVASLHGESLLRFFLKQLPTEIQPKFRVLAQNAIVEHYRKNDHDIYAPEIHKAAILFCQHADLTNSNNSGLKGGEQ